MSKPRPINRVKKIQRKSRGYLERTQKELGREFKENSEGLGREFRGNSVGMRSKKET